MKRKLSTRQQLFVRYYLQSFNASEAARRAGYGPRFPSQQASKVMASPLVQAEIQQRMAVLTSKLDVTAERVIAEMCKIAFSDFSEVAEWGPNGLSLKESSGLDPSAAASVRTIAEKHTKYGKSLAVQLHDKVKALHTLGRWLRIGEQDEGLGPRLNTGIPHCEELPPGNEQATALNPSPGDTQIKELESVSYPVEKI